MNQKMTPSKAKRRKRSLNGSLFFPLIPDCTHQLSSRNTPNAGPSKCFSKRPNNYWSLVKTKVTTSTLKCLLPRSVSSDTTSWIFSMRKRTFWPRAISLSIWLMNPLRSLTLKGSGIFFAAFSPWLFQRSLSSSELRRNVLPIPIFWNRLYVPLRRFRGAKLERVCFKYH